MYHLNDDVNRSDSRIVSTLLPFILLLSSLVEHFFFFLLRAQPTSCWTDCLDFVKFAILLLTDSTLLPILGDPRTWNILVHFDELKGCSLIILTNVFLTRSGNLRRRRRGSLGRRNSWRLGRCLGDWKAAVHIGMELMIAWADTIQLVFGWNECILAFTFCFSEGKYLAFASVGAAYILTWIWFFLVPLEVSFSLLSATAVICSLCS